MGLLDEAIREHLDLKRRRGADPAEIERAEREALGPVRRPPEPGSAEQAGIVVSSETGVAETPAFGPEAPQEPDQAESERVPEAREGPVRADAVEAPAQTNERGSATAAVEPALHDEPLPDPVDGVPTAPPPEPPGPETAEYDVEQASAESAEAADDMLEETPEFLQDTPDHDRLWFEQRPPRDFDFEG